MKMKTRAFFLLLAALSITSLFAENKTLRLVSYYPREEADLFFRPITCLVIANDHIFALDNQENKGLAFELKYLQIKYSFPVGRPGQGPGDLTYPMALSVWNGRICIKDANAFSFFDSTGKFLSKFKAFAGNDTFVYREDKIYWLNPNIKEDYLIEVYQKEGKLVETFGNKFFSLDPKGSTNPFLDMSRVYEGTLLSGEESIYYFSARFGKYFFFSLEGEKLRKGDISHSFGERGKIIPAYNSAVYIERTKKASEPSGFPRPVLFEGAYVYGGAVYFINTEITKTPQTTAFELREFALDSMKLLNVHTFRKDGMCRLDALAVLEHMGRKLFLLSVTKISEGSFLELYEE